MKHRLALPILLALLFSSAAPLAAQERALASARVAIGASGYGRIDASYGRGRRGRDIRITAPIWIPGHNEWRDERIWVEGHREKVWVEPVYEDRYDACGRRTRVLVADGYWRVIEHPGHYETHRECVYVPGHWSTPHARY